MGGLGLLVVWVGKVVSVGIVEGWVGLSWLDWVGLRWLKNASCFEVASSRLTLNPYG